MTTEYFVCPKCEKYQVTQEQEWLRWARVSMPEPTHKDFADPTDCDNCGATFERDDLEIKEDPSYDSIVERFKDEVLPGVRMQYEWPPNDYSRDGRIDKPARREAWNNWTDMLCKGGEISLHAYENWDHPPECG